jgi:hypothetical protein
LNDPILEGAQGISEYAGVDVRKVRHLMANHGLPYVRRGRLIFSRASWVDRYFSADWASEHPQNESGPDLDRTQS